MHRRKRIIALAAAFVLFVSPVCSGSRVMASSLEDKKQDALNQIKEIKADINSVKDKISDLKSSKSSLQNYITELDQQAAQLDSQLTELSEAIDVKNGEIEETKEALDRAIDTVNTQYEAMKKRIQYMYENGDYSYLNMLLEASSMSDLLNRAEFASQMVDYDRRMLVSFQEAKQTVEDTKAQLEQEQAELEGMQEEVTEQKEAVDLLIDTKTQEIAEYQQKIANAEAEADDYAQQLDEQEKLLEKIENQIAAEAAKKAQELEASGGVVSASGFMWPCPSSHRITSYFGPRSQPTAGASTNHKGIDIGAASGSTIVASADGVVTTATYSSSAGNYIVISHGGGISTVYMHCSSLYVSVGTKVSQGQSIAAVGSTGYSTGPHLHFGVIKNGTYVNPLNYVS